MLRIDVLPAQRGDALWVTYDHGERTRHLLIDAGPQETIPTLVPDLESRIRAVPGRAGKIELFVITHVDADHIQGAVSLLSDHRRVTAFRDVWFNGFRHLGLLGGPDGERLTSALADHPTRWNKAFDHGPVVIDDEGPLPSVPLRGGLTLTLLGPTRRALMRLAPEWVAACERAGIVPGAGAAIAKRSWQRDGLLGTFDPDLLATVPFRADRGAPNGSSIAFVAEHGGRRVLFLGDAHASTIAEGLDRLGPGPHRFDAVKLSHHGSRGNTSLELLERIRCSRWIVSSNGAQFGHPDAECLARVVVTQRRPTFYLNYLGESVDDLVSGAGDRYRVVLPRRGRDGERSGVSVVLR